MSQLRVRAVEVRAGEGGVRRILRLVLFAVSMFPGPALAVAYYVAPNGSDSGNPGTESRPFRTIQKAANTLVAGDLVYIKEGTYRERVIPRNSGSAGHDISYLSFPGDTVTIDGGALSLPDYQSGLFEISGKSHLRISGLRIVNAGPHDDNNGIFVENSSHIVIEDCYTYNSRSSGIGVWDSDHIIIDGNEVELACNDGEQESITVAGTDIFEIRNNHVHHGGPGSLGGEGIDAKDGSSNGKIYRNHVHHMSRVGIYVDSWDKYTHTIEVFGNRVHDCAEDGFSIAAEAGGLLENVKVYNNVAYDNGYVGLTVAGWGDPVPQHPMRDIEVIHNTFYRNGQGSWGGGISVENPDVQNLLIRNNILSQNLTFQIQVDVPVQSLIADHNLIDGYRGSAGEIYGSDPVVGDPGFENPAGGNFHLLDNSPAVDQGSPLSAPGEDFDGLARPQGPGYDIGAYEYPAGSWWSASPALAAGWRWLDWFGYFNVNLDPWIWHHEHGWLYPVGTTASSLWFWDAAMNAYWWTSDGTYRRVYRPGSPGTWLYYSSGATPNRLFYNYTTLTWEEW